MKNILNSYNLKIFLDNPILYTLPEEYFERIIPVIKERANIEMVSYLGSGANGHCFLLDNNRVMKLTTSETEYNYSLILHHFQKEKGLFQDCFSIIYEIFKIKNSKLFMGIIIQEKLTLHNFNEQELIFKILENIFILPEKALFYVFESQLNLVKKDYEMFAGLINKNLNSINNDILIPDDNYPISKIDHRMSFDIHIGNLGFDKNNKIKAFDINFV